MNPDTKNALTQKAHLRHLLRRLGIGVETVGQNRAYQRAILIYLLGASILLIFRRSIFYIDDAGLFASAVDNLYRFALLFCVAVGLLALVVWLGTPVGYTETWEQLVRAGLTNHIGEVPILISRQPDKENLRVTVLKFDPCGIPVNQWEDKRSDLEAALNVNIVDIQYAEGKDRVLLKVVPAINALPIYLPWSDSYIFEDDFILSLGEGFLGPVTVDLSKIPHILLGGSTGSGKSVLLKVLLLQCLQKGAYVAIADFKGGVDFTPGWRERCRMCFDEQTLLEVLDFCISTLEKRKKLFSRAGTPNIREYNRMTGEDLPRYILACDEISEVLDKTGLNKEQKDVVAQIENRLATIARQGRAFGIHLILATQRPDATVISGQIRNNIDFRVCGRADNVLSQIILDNTSAADQIPKDARGRFITGDGTAFQGYWFEDRDL